MGMYINKTQNGELPSLKVNGLVAAGATVISKTKNPGYQPNLICVVNNGGWEAAGYMYSEREYQDFTHPSDTRLKTWLLWDRAEEFAQ